MNEYTVKDYIFFINNNRKDKLSPFALEKIGKGYLELENFIFDIKQLFISFKNNEKIYEFICNKEQDLKEKGIL